VRVCSWHRCAYAVQHFSAADGQKLMVGFRVYLPPLVFAVIGPGFTCCQRRQELGE
jgi:hypothetical protein